MNVVLRQRMTLEQFLAWEEGQELRYEFDGFQPVAMTGGTARHGAIRGALFTALSERLRGRPCRCWGPDEKIEVAGRIRYPDVFVSCTRADPRGTIIPEPVVVFEILSPGTSRIDRIEKVREYQATASIRRYVILEQDSVGAQVFARSENGWSGFALGEGNVLDLPEIGVSLVLAELYVDAGLEPASP